MREVRLGFPGIIFLWVSFPFDKVSLTLFLQDFFDLEFFVFLGLEVERRLKRGVWISWFQKRYVEYWVDSCVIWQFESVVEVASLFNNQEGSDFHMIQFLASFSCLQVLRQKVDLIPLLKQRTRLRIFVS